MGNYLIYLVLLKNRDDFSTIVPALIALVFHLVHGAWSIVACAPWVLLVNLNDLCLLLNSGIRSWVEASLHVHSKWIWILNWASSLMSLSDELLLGLDRVVQRLLIKLLAAIFWKLSFQLWRSLNARASWQNDWSSLPWYLMRLFYELLSALEPFFGWLSLMIYLNIWIIHNIVLAQAVDWIVSGSFIHIPSLVVLSLVWIHIDKLLLRSVSLHLEVGVLVRSLAWQLLLNAEVVLLQFWVDRDLRWLIWGSDCVVGWVTHLLDVTLVLEVLGGVLLSFSLLLLYPVSVTLSIWAPR